MTIPLVDGKDVSRLNNQELRSVMNALLTAEAGQHGVPLSDLDLTTRETDPDGGVDARIVWPSKTHELLAAGENVVQYKSGKLDNKSIRTEFNKPGVQKSLRGGGYYLLVVGHDYVHKSAVSRQKLLTDLCRNRRIGARRAKLVFGSAIGRWISRYPSVIALPELRKNIREFVTVERWRTENRQLSNPFRPDSVRTETISKIHNFLEPTSTESLLRIEGPAGVGKTRLVLEAVCPAQYAARTLYALSAEHAEVQPFLSAIYSDSQMSAVAVLDECDVAQQNFLRQYAEASNGRLKLICVGLSDILYDSPPPGYNAGLPAKTASRC